MATNTDLVDVVCSVGPPCSYIRQGINWLCGFSGDCEYQRPKRIKRFTTKEELKKWVDSLDEV